MRSGRGALPRAAAPGRRAGAQRSAPTPPRGSAWCVATCRVPDTSCGSGGRRWRARRPGGTAAGAGRTSPGAAASSAPARGPARRNGSWSRRGRGCRPVRTAPSTWATGTRAGMGHSSIVVPRRYARLTDEHVRAEAERIAGRSAAEASRSLAPGAVGRVNTAPERCESG